MNSEDKEILELLKKNQAIKAPDNFTSNVMKSVMEIETAKNASFQFSNIALMLLISSSLIASLFVFYYFDNTFFNSIISYFTVIGRIFSNQFSWIDSQAIDFLGFAKKNYFVFGLIIIILALLSFDRIVLGRSIKVNMLSIVGI